MKIIWHGERRAKKALTCDHCLTPITSWTTYRDLVLEGQVPFRSHMDCSTVAETLFLLQGKPPEGILLHHDVEFQDAAWIWKSHPTVARRLNFPESRK